MHNKNLMDVYNPEQEKIKEALWAYMRSKGLSLFAFSKMVDVTPQSLASIFRGAKMTPKIEHRMIKWLKENDENR